MKIFPEHAMKVLVNAVCPRIRGECGNLGSIVTEECEAIRKSAELEAERAEKVLEFRICEGYASYNPLFNDRELLRLIALLYLGRLFDDPSRRKACLQTCDSLTEEELLAIVDASAMATSQPELPTSTKVALEKVFFSTYFSKDPKHYNENASPTMVLLGERLQSLGARPGMSPLVERFSTLKQTISNMYELSYWGTELAFEPFQVCVEENFFLLSPPEAARLLLAAKSSKLLYDLISLMPPRYTKDLSHEQAVCSCVEHARLWLLNSELPLFYNFPQLRYCDIGKPEMNKMEQKVWASEVGFHARLPSPMEKTCRRNSLRNIWEQSQGEGVAYMLSPADFEAAGRCDSLLRWFRFPVLLQPGETPQEHVLLFIDQHDDMLDEQEPESKLQALELLDTRDTIKKKKRASSRLSHAGAPCSHMQ